MPLQATSGAASYDAFGGGAAAVPNYIEDVFSAWLYSGNSSTQTITNGIDLSTKGGMVWTKSRNAAYDNTVYDTARGTGNNKALYTDTTDAEGAFTSFQDLTAYNTNGYSIGSPILLNETGKNYVSWTFREQPKFFDVVTYTGDGTNGRAIPHNLGSTPGCILIKRTSGAEDWIVYHRSLGQQYYAVLNSQIAFQGPDTAGPFWNTAPTDTTFTVRGYDPTNKSGSTYVAYLFAHDAGGFGLTGTDNVISCGTYTGNGSATGPTITLGYEPQWVLWKNASLSDASWCILDNMRGITTSGNDPVLIANTSGSEYSGGNYMSLTATGFNITTTETNTNGSGNTIIYIAIRRGPMKVPTVGTTVFNGIARTGTGANASITTVGFSPDLLLGGIRSPGGLNYTAFIDKLRGKNIALQSGSSGAEFAPTSISVSSFDQNGYSVGPDTGITNYNDSGVSYITWALKRAPSFFDMVCYTGNGTTQNISHNLGVVPEMMIVKRRSLSGSWVIYTTATSNGSILQLDSAGSVQTSAPQWNTTTPTASVFSLGTSSSANASGSTYVWYGFATCVGVSKVGSYTGNGSTQTINCGFGAGGARFVLIKRTDSTGDWYVYDTIRGMTVLTDPYLLWNTTNAESATLGSVTTVSTGFALNSTILADINVNGGTYIFLAIA
jgi:hypothetical protein